MLLEVMDTNVSHAPDFEYDLPYGADFWLLIMTYTPAIFRLNGKEVRYPKDTMILYPAHQPIYYRACEGIYKNDYMRFHLTGDGDIPNGTPLSTPVVIPLGDQCHQMFSLIAVEAFHRNKFWELNIDSLIRLLLNKMIEFDQNDSLPPKYTELLELRRQIHSDYARPWTLASMADQLHISQGHLQTLYREVFHITCMDDVIEARIYAAKDQLTYHDMPVTEVAYHCGYNSPEHFFRQFKKYTGMTPREYRKKYQKSQRQ